jgi:hypothetical protein
MLPNEPRTARDGLADADANAAERRPRRRREATPTPQRGDPDAKRSVAHVATIGVAERRKAASDGHSTGGRRLDSLQ